MSTPTEQALGLEEPTFWPQELRAGRKNTWVIRRVDQVTALPFVPTEVHAQLRREIGGELWLDWSSDTIDEDMARVEIHPTEGWVYFITPAAATAGAAWGSRFGGYWDIEWVVDGESYPLITPSWVRVTHNVTQGA